MAVPLQILGLIGAGAASVATGGYFLIDFLITPPPFVPIATTFRDYVYNGLSPVSEKLGKEAWIVREKFSYRFLDCFFNLIDLYFDEDDGQELFIPKAKSDLEWYREMFNRVQIKIFGSGSLLPFSDSFLEFYVPSIFESISGHWLHVYPGGSNFNNFALWNKLWNECSLQLYDSFKLEMSKFRSRYTNPNKSEWYSNKNSNPVTSLPSDYMFWYANQDLYEEFFERVKFRSLAREPVYISQTSPESGKRSKNSFRKVPIGYEKYKGSEEQIFEYVDETTYYCDLTRTPIKYFWRGGRKNEDYVARFLCWFR